MRNLNQPLVTTKIVKGRIEVDSPYYKDCDAVHTTVLQYYVGQIKSIIKN